MNLIQKYFNKKVRKYVEDNKLTLIFDSIDVFDMIRKYLNLYPNKTNDVYIKKPIKNLFNDFLTYFVRGMFDTDGHHKKDGRLTIGLTSNK